MITGIKLNKYIPTYMYGTVNATYFHVLQLIYKPKIKVHNVQKFTPGFQADIFLGYEYITQNITKMKF
jgi:hypothetical protein